MKLFSAIILLTVSSISFADANKNGDAKLFKCMDKSTFAINSDCMTKNIESNLVFQQAQDAVTQKANDVSDRAIATMTFDPKTMSIEIVAHRDALLAKVDR